MTGKRKTTQSATAEIFQKYEGRIEMIGDYITGGRNNSYKCNDCGNIFTTRFDTLMASKVGCSSCESTSRRTSSDDYIKIFNKKYKGKIKLLEDYKTARIKLSFLA